MVQTQNDVKTQTGKGATKKLLPPRRRGEEKLKSERVQEMLKSMPGWQRVSRKQAVTRKLDFPDAEAALSFGSYVMKMARSHKRRVSLTYDATRLTLTVHGTGRVGLTKDTLLFAARLG